MKIVDRHLGMEFLRTFAVTITAFVLVFFVVDFFEKLRVLLRFEPRLADLALYFAARIPWMAVQVIPVGALVATVASVTLLSRSGEITALRCGGVPLRRLAVPFAVSGLGLAFATVFLQEVLVPRGAAFAREVNEIRIRKHPPSALLRSEDLWIRSGPRIVHVDLVGPEPGVLRGVTVAEIQGGRVVRRLEAESARWDEGAWVLQGAVDRSFRPDGSFITARVDSMPYTLGEGPNDFHFEDMAAEEISWAELTRRVERYRTRGVDTQELQVGLWRKTSLPFASVIMMLLGFPFALGAGRRGGASLGIVLALALGFSYWLVFAAALSLGKAGELPPAASAWVANLVFAAIALVLLCRAENKG